MHGNDQLMMSISSVSSAWKSVPQSTKSAAASSNVAQEAGSELSQFAAAIANFQQADEVSFDSQIRENLGAQQSVVDADTSSLALEMNALSQSRSSIMDIDVAQETANLTLFQIKQQAAVSMLSQANSQPQIALSLLNGL